jgi:predicted ribosomally synthesized peptide with nif11-like leader
VKRRRLRVGFIIGEPSVGRSRDLPMCPSFRGNPQLAGGCITEATSYSTISLDKKVRAGFNYDVRHFVMSQHGMKAIRLAIEKAQLNSLRSAVASDGGLRESLKVAANIDEVEILVKSAGFTISRDYLELIIIRTWLDRFLRIRSSELEAFQAAVIANTDLQDKLKAANNADEIVGIAREAGFEFSKMDLEASPWLPGEDEEMVNWKALLVVLGSAHLELHRK